jgi:hypothetical protein
MSDPLADYQNFRAFSEAYEVVRTAVVLMHERTFRVEILRCYSNISTPYVARYWVQEEIGKYKRTWVAFDAGWVARPNPVSAMAQALGFLAQATKKA